MLDCCPACGHVYNSAYDAALLKYGDEYDNSLHHSETFRLYATGLASHLAREHDLGGKHVVELGCGKGDFLVELCGVAGCTGTGYDRSYDGRFAETGVTFRREYADGKDMGEFDFFVSRHVLEHLTEPHDFLSHLRSACGDRSVAGYVEVPDAIYDFERSGWDCIYPHISYFSATSLARLAIRAGFAILRLVRNFHGQFLALELGVNVETPDAPPFRGMGLSREREILAHFPERHPGSIADWRDRIADAGYDRCALWGAGAKGVSFLNAIDASAELAAVVDINPGKWHRYLPVTGHEILPPQELPPHVEYIVTTNPAYEREIATTLSDLGLHSTILVA